MCNGTDERERGREREKVKRASESCDEFMRSVVHLLPDMRSAPLVCYNTNNCVSFNSAVFQPKPVSPRITNTLQKHKTDNIPVAL